MTKKTTTGFSLDKAISRITKPSVFDKIVKEIDAKEIPAKYVEYVLIQYYDGSVVEISGADLTHPIPLKRNIIWDKMEESFKKMRDVRVFISTDQLEIDINIMVEAILGKYC